jgi:hypothetical protein
MRRMPTPAKKIVLPPLPPKKEVGPLLPFDPKKLPESDFQTPDFMEPRYGWRAWAIEAELPSFGLPPKLHSVSWGYYWAPRRKAAADCSRAYPCSEPRVRQSHGKDVEVVVGVPGEDCSCGFYSAKTFEHLQSMGYHVYYPDSGRFTVVGKVYNWGKVVECQTGWRSQYAYPAKLFVPIEAAYLAAPLAKAYAPKEGVVLRNVLEHGGADGEPRRIKRLADFKRHGRHAKTTPPKAR